MKNNNPLISIVLPTYNQSKLLKRAIDSVIAQTFNDWEILLINNFSKDDTLDTVDSFKDKRIKVFNFANNGVIAKSRNLGIKKASSKYVAFLDSDDFWYPDKLKKVYEKLLAGYEMVCHDENWFKYEKFLYKKNYKPLSKLNYKKLLFEGNCFSTSAVTLLKSKLEKVNCFNENPNIVGIEDYDLWLRLISKKIKLKFIEDSLGIYYLHNNNHSKSLIKRFKAEFKVITIHSSKFNLKKPIIFILYLKRLSRLAFSILKAIFN